MKAIKLWQVNRSADGRTAVEIQTTHQTETEQLLEDLLTECPDLLMAELTLIGRQTETANGPLDLLGLDADGNLVVFELKRGQLTREAVAQVIDYGSYLAELDPDELAEHIEKQSGKLGIDEITDFREKYQELFSRDLDTMGKPRLVLVGLGVEERAQRMVSFLADSDIDISLITFHAFEENGRMFLARQVEVEARTGTNRPYNKKANLHALKSRVADLGVGDFYFDMAAFFRSELPAAYEYPNPNAFSYSLPELTDSGSNSLRVYYTLYLYPNDKGKMYVSMHQRAIAACDKNADELASAAPVPTEQRRDAILFYVSTAADWDKLSAWLKPILPQVIVGWQVKREAAAQEALEDASSQDEL